MKITPLFTVFFFFTSLVLAQKDIREIDSLQLLLNKKNNSFQEKIELLNKVTRLVGKYDFKKGRNLNNQLLEISKKQHNSKGYGYYHLNLSNEKMYQGEFIEAENQAEKARLIFKKLKDHNNYITTIYNICHAKEMQETTEKFNEAEKLALATIKEFETKPNKDKLVVLYQYLSTAFNYEKKPRLAFLYINKALDIYSKNNDDEGFFICNSHMAYLCILNDMPQKSLFYLNRFQPSSKVFLNSSTSNKLRVHELYLTNYITLKQFDNALQHCNFFYSIARENKIDAEIKIANIFYAEIYTQLKQYKKAANYIAYLDTQENEDWQIYQLNSTKSKLYFALKEYKKALYYGKKNYQKKPEDTDNIKLLADIENALSNYKQSIRYFQEYLKVKVAQLKKEKESQIYEYEALYELKNKDNAIQKSNLENANKEIALQKQKEFLNLLIMIALSLFLIVVFLITIYLTNKKNNRLVMLKNEDLSNLNKQLEQANKEKTILLKEIHHRVKNNLQLVMSLLNIQARSTESTSIETFLEKGQSRIEAMSLIHQNLYQSHRLDKVEFQDYIENLVQHIATTFQDKSQNISIEVNANNSVFDIETAIPLGLIINELTSNAFKHAFSKDRQGKIKINLTQKNTTDYELIINDDGIGIVPNANRKKTLGLELVSLLTLQLNGEMTTNSTQGTHYTINFRNVA